MSNDNLKPIMALAKECGATVYTHRSSPHQPAIAFSPTAWGNFESAIREAIAAPGVAAMRDALESIREHCKVQPSALAKAIVTTCDSALSAAPGVAQGLVMVPKKLPRHARVYLLNGESSWAALLNTVSVPCHAEQPLQQNMR